MKRRDFVLGAASFAAVSRVAAQPVTDHRRMAIVDLSVSQSRMHEDVEGHYGLLLSDLRRRGHVEGKNSQLSVMAKSKTCQIMPPSLRKWFAAIRMSCTFSFPSLRCERRTQKFRWSPYRKTRLLLVLPRSLAHPGGNITGVSVDAGPSIHGKRIALLREILPSISKLGVIAGRVQWEVRGAAALVRDAANAAGVPLVSQLVDVPGDATTYRAAIEQAAREGADAIMMLDGPDVLANRVSIVQSLADVRIPAIHAFSSAVDAGGLMAYSFDLKEVTKRVAEDLDAICVVAIPPTFPITKCPNSICRSISKPPRRLG